MDNLITIKVDKTINLHDLIKFAATQGCVVTSKDGELIIRKQEKETIK